MLIIVLEIFFIYFKNSPKVKGLNIFKHEFLYSAYADDNTVFLKDRKFITELRNELNTFSNFSRLQPNKMKCKIESIGFLIGVQLAPCTMKYVNLNSKTVKILGVHFSYNNYFQQDKNFCEHILKTENILKIWHMRQLTLGGLQLGVFKI